MSLPWIWMEMAAVRTVPEEPQMPPLDETRASATFYYTHSSEKAQEYWDLSAKRVDRGLNRTLRGRGNALEIVAIDDDFHHRADARGKLALRTQCFTKRRAVFGVGAGDGK